MATEQETEFSRRRGLPGVTVRYVDGGKRCMEVELSRNGTDLGSQTLIYKHGKVSSRLFVLPPLRD